MRFASLLAFCLAAATAYAVDLSPAIPANCRQVVLVTAHDWSASRGTLQRYERADAHTHWQTAGAPVEVLLGSRGLAWGLGLAAPVPGDGPRKIEGDQRAPAGVFELGTAFGRATREEVRWLHLPYQQLSPTTEAIDDPKSHSYNRIVDHAQIAQPDWHSSEHMGRIPDYEWGLVVAHNPQHVPRAGSCIFIHLWMEGRDGTHGCTALHRADLMELLHWLDQAKHPVLVQLPEKVARESLVNFFKAESAFRSPQRFRTEWILRSRSDPMPVAVAFKPRKLIAAGIVAERRLPRQGWQTSLRDGDDVTRSPWLKSHGYRHGVAPRLDLAIDAVSPAFQRQTDDSSPLSCSSMNRLHTSSDCQIACRSRSASARATR
ncbi:MAG: L,D-transpeptidase family protein [Chthoniobacter sp.]|nr:L,D-transpeptidase family protein [Chthoniobacter sp.]